MEKADDFIFNLRACPFCGRIPMVNNARFEHRVLYSLSLHCCMDFEIESDIIYNDGNGVMLSDDGPVAKWNARANENEH